MRTILEIWVAIGVGVSVVATNILFIALTTLAFFEAKNEKNGGWGVVFFCILVTSFVASGTILMANDVMQRW